MTFLEALAELHRRNCLPDRHDDACLALTAGFDGLVAERDLAHRVAVDLEQQNARLRDLASCGICGNTVDPDEVDDYLTNGAHGLCLADEQRDAAIDFDFAEA